MSGGPFTRYEPSKPNDDESKSYLDIAIISKVLVKYLEKIEIDKNLSFTPCRPVNKGSLRFPDHYAFFIKFKKIPKKNLNIVTKKKHITWNTHKGDGWSRYNVLTHDNANLKDINASNINDATEAHKVIS